CARDRGVIILGYFDYW
nr:immunoglobulin heavy chain junction region [Macaca mulatta]